VPLRVPFAWTVTTAALLTASIPLAQGPQSGSIAGHIKLTTHVRAPLPANA